MTGTQFPTQSLYTGVGLIDSQHQTFLTILDKIKKSDYRNNPEELAMLVDELHLYTMYHFECEENLLEEHGSPNLEEHREKHQTLIDLIEEYRLDNMSDSCLLADAMSNFLEKWLFEHIINTDKEDLKVIKK